MSFFYRFIIYIFSLFLRSTIKQVTYYPKINITTSSIYIQYEMEIEVDANYSQTEQICIYHRNMKCVRTRNKHMDIHN